MRRDGGVGCRAGCGGRMGMGVERGGWMRGGGESVRQARFGDVAMR